MTGIVVGGFFVECGVVAGCSLATSLIRVHAIPALDGLRLPPKVSLDVYIDDYGLSGSGTVRDVISILGDSAKGLQRALEQ